MNLVEIRDRFWSKVDIIHSPLGQNLCWEWKAAKNGSYGYVRTAGRKNELAHRVAYKLTKGPIPEGMYVCHLCDNPLCCNPRHLWLGTDKDNTIDARDKGRLDDRKGSKNSTAKLTESDVMGIRAVSNTMTCAEIGEKYGVSGKTVSRIRRGDGWRHV